MGVAWWGEVGLHLAVWVDPSVYLWRHLGVWVVLGVSSWRVLVPWWGCGWRVGGGARGAAPGVVRDGTRSCARPGRLDVAVEGLLHRAYRLSG